MFHGFCYVLCYFIPTCDNVPDRLNKSGEGRDVRLPVLPHWLPDDQAAGQSEGQVRFLKQNGRKKKIFIKKGNGSRFKGPMLNIVMAIQGLEEGGAINSKTILYNMGLLKCNKNKYIV